MDTPNMTLPLTPTLLNSSNLPGGPSTSPENVHVNNESDVDSALGGLDSRPSTTESMTSECWEYPLVLGRTYHKHKYGKYFLPNDEKEQERLDMQHKLWELTLSGRLHLAPLNQIANVLDIGTGTGIWACQFGTAYPTADVIGVDLSPIQPKFVPSNVQFQVDDAEDQWNFSRKFNYVHGRMLFTCFHDSQKIIKMAFESLDPGGYLELQDAVLPFESIDGSLEGTAVKKWVEDLICFAKIQRRDWTCASKYKGYLEDAGFVDVKQEMFYWPINSWAKGEEDKLIGTYCLANLLDGLEAFSMCLFTKSGSSMEAVQLRMVDVRKDLKNRNIHAYIPVVVVYGRKPRQDKT